MSDQTMTDLAAALMHVRQLHNECRLLSRENQCLRDALVRIVASVESNGRLVAYQSDVLDAAKATLWPQKEQP